MYVHLTHVTDVVYYFVKHTYKITHSYIHTYPYTYIHTYIYVLANEYPTIIYGIYMYVRTHTHKHITLWFQKKLTPEKHGPKSLLLTYK
jgi:hypothetical protein